MADTDGANADHGGQKRRGRPQGSWWRGVATHRQRNAVVPDEITRLVVEPDGPEPADLGQKLDRWESPHRDGTARRDSRTRKAASLAYGRMGDVGREAVKDGFESPVDDPRVLRAQIAYFEALAAVWISEEAEEAVKAWLPYDDPLAALREEVGEARARVMELERAEHAAKPAERDKRLEGVRVTRSRTSDLRRLDPDSPAYRDATLAHMPPDQRDAFAASWDAMQAEEHARRKPDAWGRLRVDAERADQAPSSGSWMRTRPYGTRKPKPAPVSVSYIEPQPRDRSGST